MATKYGLKEVADFYFFDTTDYITVSVSSGNVTVSATNTAGATTSAKFIFDTLKVSNLEFTSEEATANGGQGNPDLITWSYGKKATLTLTDALLSVDTMKLMFGGEGTGTITIASDKFPQGYSMVGVTYMRNSITQKDEPFVIYIPKGQPTVNNTITLEAEGDPATFEMSVKVLNSTVEVNEVKTPDVLVQMVPVGSGDTTIALGRVALED